MSETINNETNREDESGIKREKVRVVPLKYVDDFPNHPFRVKDDDEIVLLMAIKTMSKRKKKLKSRYLILVFV